MCVYNTNNVIINEFTLPILSFMLTIHIGMCAHGFPSLSPDYYVRDKPENVSIYVSVCIYVIFGKEKTKKIIGSSGDDAG